MRLTIGGEFTRVAHPSVYSEPLCSAKSGSDRVKLATLLVSRRRQSRAPNASGGPSSILCLMDNVTTPTRLNLGCGTDIREGWVNLDSVALPGVDVVHNLDEFPIPLPTGRFEEIVCNDILEHIELVPVLRELHRLLAPGGVLHIRSPHFTSRNVYMDPTHRRAFSVSTFDFFTLESSHGRHYYFDFGFSSIRTVEITFIMSFWLPWNYVMYRLVNFNAWWQRYYELTGLSRLFPAHNVNVTLIR